MKLPTIHLRLANDDDLEMLLNWRREAVAWLGETQDTDQWSGPDDPDRIEDRVAKGETFMASLSEGGDAVATITSSTRGDPVLWTEEELREHARYAYRIMVGRAHAGHGIGECLGLWARSHAARTGFPIIRYNAWATNEKLLDYYRNRLGGNHIRTVPGIRCGALFEDPTEVRHDLPVVENDDLYT